jgi:hypothetical protein
MKKLLFFTILFCLIISSCDFFNYILNPRDIRIRYQVAGTASEANIQYRDSSGESVTRNNAVLPWSDTFYVSNGFTANLKATISDSNKVVTARLYVNGELVKESSGRSIVTLYEWIWIDKDN